MTTGSDSPSLLPGTLDAFPRRYDHAVYTCLGPVLRGPERITFPLGYPDPAGELFGYDAPTLPSHDNPVRNVRSLVTAACWIATVTVALESGVMVVSKAESVRAYREHVGDPWTPWLEELWALAHDQWEYRVPDDSAEFAQLRHLCADMLPFENRYLKRYRAWLLSLLRSSDASARSYALGRLELIVFPDDVVTRAIEGARG